MSDSQIVWLVFALSLLFCGGCEMYRTIEVESARVEVSSSNSAGLPPELAVNVFHDVAKELGYTVRGPESVSPHLYEYTANPPGSKYGSQPQLVLWVDEKRIRFESGIYGTSQQFTNAQAVAALFQHALDIHGIHYTTRIWKDIGILGP